MWLINARTFELEEFVGNDSPSYAILSHRWGKAEDEVSFTDMSIEARTQKKGWQKIEFCCAQALQDKSSSGEAIAYVWIDTCCIDKRSSAELSEAINSMYRWYRDADICYAYLQDVSNAEEFASSDWWTRGWTLQELLAPATDVVFYGRDWSLLGTRNEKRRQIADMTGIDPQALKGESLHQFNVANKMSWAAPRRTTRVEDRAYSLLGLFNVNMPLLYGEGSKAFERLQQAILQTATDDITIFAWSSRDKGHEARAGLATSPSAFAAPLYFGSNVTSFDYFKGPNLSSRHHQERQATLLDRVVHGVTISNLGVSSEMLLIPWTMHSYFIPLCFGGPMYGHSPQHRKDGARTGVLGMVVRWDLQSGKFYRAMCRSETGEEVHLFFQPVSAKYYQIKRILLANSDVVGLYNFLSTGWATCRQGILNMGHPRDYSRVHVAHLFDGFKQIDSNKNSHCDLRLRSDDGGQIDIYAADHVSSRWYERNSRLSFIVPHGASGTVGWLHIRSQPNPELFLFFGFFHDFNPYCLALNMDQKVAGTALSKGQALMEKHSRHRLRPTDYESFSTALADELRFTPSSLELRLIPDDIELHTTAWLLLTGDLAYRKCFVSGLGDLTIDFWRGSTTEAKYRSEDAGVIFTIDPNK